MLAEIAAYVDAHLEEPLTLKAIAAHCGVSVSTVTQLFQHRADMTFHGFVTARRMEKALELIQNGIPLEVVGRQVGYRNHSTFYRAFRQHYDLSPREYRSRMTAETED